MMTTAKTKTVAVMCVVVMLAVGGLALATPVIKNSSSKGGRTTNKTGPKDTMYLVKSGDKITFSVKADDAKKYVWQVNKKVDTEATGEKFVWAVPDEKGIWEIHLKASDEEGGVHAEWVVSTLPKAEAPTVFEYFADKKFRKRTETDPWGRKLPEWRIPGLWNPKTKGKVVTSECVMRGLTPHKNYRYNRLRYEYPRRLDAYGTWVFWFRYPNDSTVPYLGYSVRIIDDRNPLKDYGFWHVTESWDTHAWINIDARDENKVRRGNIVLDEYIAMAGTGILKGKSGFRGTGWHKIVAVRTPDNYFYAWRTDDKTGKLRFINASLGYHYLLSKTRRMELHVGLNSANPPEYAVLDGIRFYEKKYLWPFEKASLKIAYGKYVNLNRNYRHKDPEYRDYRTGWPVKKIERKGIILRGRGITLADIAKVVGDEKLFRYDKGKKVATCRTNLVVTGGAELILNNETLKMACSTDGEYEIRLKGGATLKLNGSTITTTGKNYFLWRITNAHDPELKFGLNSGKYCMQISNAWIEFKNSHIDNCGDFYLEGASTVVMENTKFTRLVNIPNYGGHHPKAFAMTTKCVMDKYVLKGLYIEGRKSPARVYFIGPDMFGQINIIDSVFRNVDLSAYKFKFEGVPRKKDKYLHRTLNLINCKFDSATTVKPATDDADIAVKYYLDVRVVDAAGKPVKGASCKVTSDNGAVICSLEEKQVWTVTGKEGIDGGHLYNEYLKWVTEPLKATHTLKDGHTPSPTDKKHCMVLTDFVLNKDGKKELTYTITVEKGGRKKVITGVNPGLEWYRPDPNKPAYTITAVLDGKTVSEAELKKGQK